MLPRPINLNEGSLSCSSDSTWHRIGFDGRLSWTVGSLISVLKTRSDLARKQQGRLFKNRLGLKNRFLGVIEIFSTLRGSKRPKTDGQKKFPFLFVILCSELLALMKKTPLRSKSWKLALENETALLPNGPLGRLSRFIDTQRILSQSLNGLA